MNYERIYNQIIERGKQRLLEGYGENHHIVPKCMGGADTQDNIVRLTAREHFICHLLLVEIHPDSIGLEYASWFMVNTRRVKVSSRLYERLREAHSKRVTQKNKGVPRSEEVKRKISKALKGLKRSEETKRKISEARKGKEMPKEQKDKLSKRNTGNGNPMYGRLHTEETKKLLSQQRKGRPAHNKGKKMSEETKRKLSESQKKRHAKIRAQKKL